MKPATELHPNSQPRTRRKPPEIKFPFYTLADSVAVAQAIHEKGGGRVTKDQLAAFLNYSTTNSGAFVSRLASARTFNLIATDRGDLIITPLAQEILMPVRPEQHVEGLVRAFIAVPLFRDIYEEHKGKELPPAFGFKNLLRTKYGITGRTADIAYRSLMESADQAKFFATRGAKTHLIMPSVSPQRKHDEPGATLGSEPEHGGGGDDGKMPPTLPAASTVAKEQMRMKYVEKLFEMLDATDDKAEKKEFLDRIEQFLKG